MKDMTTRLYVMRNLELNPQKRRISGTTLLLPCLFGEFSELPQLVRS